MKYFIDEKTRKESGSTCFLDFQKGYYHDKCWLNDSINISDTLWNKLELSKLFSIVLADFDYYGLNVVNKEQWNKIVEISRKMNAEWEEVIAEVTPWVSMCFDENEVFTIIGM